MAKPRGRPQLSMQAAAFHDDAAGIPQNHWCRRFYEHVFLKFDDGDFADLYHEGGRYPISPRLLACISILQYMFKASDRQAVENTIMRRDWRIALGLTPDYDGFDASVLCNFRKRLIAGNRADELFRTVLAVVHELGLFKKVCKVRVDATALLADVAVLSRCDMIKEAMRVVLRELSRMRPKIRRRAAFKRLVELYGEEVWLGGAEGGDEKLTTLALDAQLLLRLCGPYPVEGKETLERILEENFTFSDDGTPTPKPADELPQDHIASPHDPDAEVGKNRDRIWTGDKAHFVETTGTGKPGFIVDVLHTGPRVPDNTITGEILQRLRFGFPQVDTVLADSGYASAHNSLEAQSLGYELISPPRVNNTRGIFPATDFTVDFANRVAYCPAGHASRSWFVGERLRIKFSRKECAACPLRSRCTTSATEPRTLNLSPNYEQLVKDRERASRPGFAAQYAERAGVEATISQLVRDCGLRRSRYRSRPKRHLHALLAATALNVRRLLACLGSPDTPVGGVFRAFSGFAQGFLSAARTARGGVAGRFWALRRFPGAAAPSGC